MVKFLNITFLLDQMIKLFDIIVFKPHPEIYVEIKVAFKKVINISCDKLFFVCYLNSNAEPT